MHRRFLALLSLSVFGSTACVVEFADAFVPAPELPVRAFAQDVWIAEKPEGFPEYIPSERQAVTDCVQQWNDATAPYRKEGAPKPFEFQDFIAVPDFDPQTSIHDRLTVIYKVPDLSPDLRSVFNSGGYLHPGFSMLGYGLPGSDVLIFPNEFVGTLGTEPAIGLAQAQAILLKNVICHELGHVLGVQHHLEFGVMNTTIRWDGWDGSDRYVTDADVRAFRLVHPDDYR